MGRASGFFRWRRPGPATGPAMTPCRRTVSNHGDVKMTFGPSTTRRPALSWRALLGGSALALALAPMAIAQTPPDDSDTVVVTGSATPVEHDKLGYSITVVPEELIEDQGYSYVPDVLRQVPGVAVNRGGAFGA